jgi:transposase
MSHVAERAEPNTLDPKTLTRASAEVQALLAAQGTMIEMQRAQIADLKRQLEWFRRQVFGAKSERLTVLEQAQQLSLGEGPSGAAAGTLPKTRTVAAHTRHVRTREADETEGQSAPFFDERCVPVETIELPDPQVRDLARDEYERIGEKLSYRLAQRPGSYVVLKYVRPLHKRLDTQKISCPAAPVGVIEGSRADVSFIAGLLMDKFAYHLPLYRQHQRLKDSGIEVTRPWLTQTVQQASALLEPIYAAQLSSIRESRVKAMDETPIKAGRTGHGKMKTGYFWPVYGERDEVCFPYCSSRAGEHVRELLGLQHVPGAVLLSDGYAAYHSYAKKLGLTHAQCWAHARRTLFEAQAADPEPVREALEQIGALYAIEEDIRTLKLTGDAKRGHRLTHSAPRVQAFFEWVQSQFQRQGLLPSSPYTQALDYVRERRLGLEVFLEDPDVPMDTNHLERALRAIPMGRKNWNFCWTELGARHVGIVQSLIVTCRLHAISPYDYLVDVLQRVSRHPAARVAELTPRLWKQHFAPSPLRSDLHTLAA